MNCPRFEKLIALSVEGDLDARDARLVEEHLGECAVCRDLHEELLGSQAVLKALNEGAIDPAVLGAVRRRVLESIEDRRPSWWLGWRWKYGLAAAVTAAVVLAVTLSPKPKVAPPPAQVAEKREPLAEEAVKRTRGHSGLVSRDRSPATARRRVPKVFFTASEGRGSKPRPIRKAVSQIPRKPAPPSGEPLVVKMLTDDPEVVIVWLIDQNGD
jgi:putative zinc finger protein